MADSDPQNRVPSYIPVRWRSLAVRVRRRLLANKSLRSVIFWRCYPSRDYYAPRDDAFGLDNVCDPAVCLRALVQEGVEGHGYARGRG